MKISNLEHSVWEVCKKCQSVAILGIFSGESVHWISRIFIFLVFLRWITRWNTRSKLETRGGKYQIFFLLVSMLSSSAEIIRISLVEATECVNGLTVKWIAGGSWGLSAAQSWNDALRLRRDTCRIIRRLRTITNATDAPVMTVAAVSAPTSRPIIRWPPLSST